LIYFYIIALRDAFIQLQKHRQDVRPVRNVSSHIPSGPETYSVTTI